MKLCSTCNILKSIEEFPSNKCEKDGKARYCRDCISIKGRYYREKNKEEVKQRKKQYSKTSRAKELKKKHRERCKEYYLDYRHQYYKSKKEKLDKENKDFFIKNPNKRAEYSSRRRAKVKARIIKLSEEHKAQIEEIYRLCAINSQQGEKFHVDHIIPLSHPKVCGLHVPWNMQILTSRENLIKGAYFDGTYDNLGWKTKSKEY